MSCTSTREKQWYSVLTNIRAADYFRKTANDTVSQLILEKDHQLFHVNDAPATISKTNHTDRHARDPDTMKVWQFALVARLRQEMLEYRKKPRLGGKGGYASSSFRMQLFNIHTHKVHFSQSATVGLRGHRLVDCQASYPELGRRAPMWRLDEPDRGSLARSTLPLTGSGIGTHSEATTAGLLFASCQLIRG